MRHLLTHTSGFSYETWNPDVGRFVQHAGLPSTGGGKRAALNLPLVFDPGERWEYGINTDWVGLAVEAAARQPLDAYCREQIFAPLGMHDTGFASSAEQRGRQARVHRRQPDGTLEPLSLEAPVDPEFHSGGGGLFSTGPDYLTFLRMLLQGGRYREAEILQPQTVALMAQNHIGELSAGVMQSAQPERSNHVDFFPGMERRWGLGYMITTEPVPGGRKAGSLTWAGIFNSYYWLDPASRVAGLMLTQILPFADPTVLRLFAEFERGVYRHLERA